jgi:putative membrane protein
LTIGVYTRVREAAVLLLVCTLITGCKREEQERAPTRAPRAAPKVAAKPAAPKTVMPEPEALHVLLTLDSSRIADALAVRERTESEAVLEFTRVLLADHRAVWRMLFSEAQADTIEPMDNATSQRLRQGTEQFVTELLARDSGINNAYIAHQVLEHEQTLMLLDTVLLQSVRDTTLRATVEQIRPMVEAHLQQARRIQAAREARARAEAAAMGAVRPDSQPRPQPIRIPTTTTNM